jgi:hypothetical protein
MSVKSTEVQDEDVLFLRVQNGTQHMVTEKALTAGVRAAAIAMMEARVNCISKSWN